MDLSDLIQKHVEELAETARDTARERRGEADLSRPAALYRARIERVDARLRLLERQRAETEKRLVAAIEAQKRLREQLEKEAKNWEGRVPNQPKPRPGTRPIVPGKTEAAPKAARPKSAGSGKSK